MFAGTWYDMVLAVDIHFELVPAPPAPPIPTPIPNPFVGLVFDPIGLALNLAIGAALGGGKPVLVNGMSPATTGTEATNKLGSPHLPLPPGIAWAPFPKSPKPSLRPGVVPVPDLPMPPPGDAILVVGSQTVHAMGSNMCRLGDLGMSCSDPVRMPAATLLAIPKGMPVIVGGPPAVDFAAALAGLLKSQWLMNRLKGLLGRVFGRLRGCWDKAVCFLTGHPVDVATGRVLTWHTDFDLPGPMPLTFERSYGSTWAGRDSPLGFGWSHPLDQAVWVERGKVVLRGENGSEVEFDTFDLENHVIRPGQQVFDPLSRFVLRCLGLNRWEVAVPDGRVFSFEPIPGGPPQIARLTSIRSRTNHEIALTYDDRARLQYVRDAAGRALYFEHDAAGRLSRVLLPHPTDNGWLPYVRYAYSPRGDLLEVHDALGAVTRYEYEGHLLVRETDRAGFSFYFGYDGRGPDASCIRTWGDGGVLDHVIDYDKAGRTTMVTDALNATTIYKMNEAFQVVEIVDPLGGTTKFEYDDDFRKTVEVDPLGNTTKYQYDAAGRKTEVSYADGAVIKYEYDQAGLLTAAHHNVGSNFTWRYDLQGRLIESSDPNGNVTRIHYDGDRLRAIEHPDATRTWYEQDAAHSITAVREVDGSAVHCTYDALGRLRTLRDEAGNTVVRYIDACGRVLRIENSIGEVQEMTYDAEGNLLVYRDRYKTVEYTYGGYHWVASKAEAGVAVRMSYDLEGRLAAVENEVGEKATYDFDECGRLRAHHDFAGGVTRRFRDSAGRVTKILSPSGAPTEMSYDPVGRTNAIGYADGAKTSFRYGTDGRILEATTPDAKLEWDYDHAGRVLREKQGEHWVESSFDAQGVRMQFTSSMGARGQVKQNPATNIVEMLVTQGEARWEGLAHFDSSGIEISRSLPGGVRSDVARDLRFAPTRRDISVRGRTVRSRSYEYSGLGPLREIDSQEGMTVYRYDDRTRMQSAVFPDGSQQFLMPDATGNRYRSPQRTDREYGPGNTLRVADGTRFEWDSDGRLTERVQPDGRRWQYHYNGAGMLAKVDCPDGKRVEYGYDALGRRVVQRVGAEERRFVWDGKVVLHEISSDRAPETWVFMPDSFEPIGKIEDNRCFGAINDENGAPREVYDDVGDLAWALTLDLYGIPRTESERKATRWPWRFAGQYADEETALHYNWFRYYDPVAGQYISRDPLGLIAGLNLYQYVSNPVDWCDPLGLFNPFDIAPYGNPGHALDGLEAHELLQSAWLRARGISRSSALGAKNPAIALEHDLHSLISARQTSSLVDVARESGEKNIARNAEYLLEELKAAGMNARKAKGIVGRLKSSALSFLAEVKRGCK